MPRKPITLVEKFKSTRQHKGKATDSITKNAASTAEANVPPPLPFREAEESHQSPHSLTIIIMDEPFNVKPINKMAVNLEAETARREKRKALMEDEGDLGFQLAIKGKKVTTWKP